MDKRYRFLGLLCALVAGGATQAQSNGAVGAYPARAIHWILPGAPGSPPDVVARIVGENLAAKLGQPVIVENRPGVSGTIALAAVAKSAPDGYTLGMFSMPQMVAPSLIPVAYDTERDFVPVTELVQTRHFLLVPAGSPFRSLGELISYAKANPGRLTFASAGAGGIPHLAAELLRLRAGIDIRHIPYKSGPFAITALLGGEVDMLFQIPAVVSGHLQSGKLRALVTLAPARLPGYPDVPTIAEAGFAGMEMADWFGIAVPAGTPKRIVDRLSTAARDALVNGDAGRRLTAAGMFPVLDSGPNEFGSFVRSELQRWAALVHDAGIHAD